MRNVLLILLAITLFGCQTYTPVVDPRAVSPENEDRYYRDQAECRAIAKGNADGWESAAKDTVVGAGVGTGTGALLGAIFGDAVTGLAAGAVIGGLAGGAKGVYKSEKSYERLYRNCMKGRGYNVLN